MKKHEEKHVKVLIYIPEKLHELAKKRIKQKMFKGITTFSALVAKALYTFTGEKEESK